MQIEHFRALPAVRALLVLAMLGFSVPASAQEVTPPSEGTKQVAGRAELQAALADDEKTIIAPGISQQTRDAKKSEAALIRQRLQEGDFQIGDQIALEVQGESTLTGTFTVGAGRILALPSLPDIPMSGILRSELPGFLTEQISRFIKDPQVRAKALIRLSLLGGVGKQGFYQLPADMLLTDAIMTAGGPGGVVDWDKSKIMRGPDAIVSEGAFHQAIASGTTLDRLNLQAGDEIVVATSSKKDWFTKLRTYALIPGLIVSLYGVGKLAGVF
ncbi:MAG: polysaccharide biosynthesis/export family protein [Gemmatimonadota bacterium]